MYVDTWPMSGWKNCHLEFVRIHGLMTSTFDRQNIKSFTITLMTAMYSRKLNFSHKCEDSVGSYKSSGDEECCINVGCKEFQKTSDHVLSLIHI